MAVYFASDVHLGLEFMGQDPSVIEKKFVGWLNQIESDCNTLILVGDVFDFWFEWKYVVPKGFVRVLGQIAKMVDRGVEVWFFAGNHDMWVRDYFEKEIGAKVCTESMIMELQGRNVFIAHGDNIGRREMVNKVLGSTFRSRVARWMFEKFVHPDVAMKFGKGWSNNSRHSRKYVSHEFGNEQEYLVKFARSSRGYDYFVFGHLHTPIIYELDEGAKMVVLGEWIENPVYGRMENGVIELLTL